GRFSSLGFSPYAPHARLNAPVFASNTAIRRLPKPSATYTSLAASSTATPAGRFKLVWLSLLPAWPALPICMRNLPVLSNFRPGASAGGGAGPPPGPPPGPPRPPRPAGARDGVASPPATQTLPFASTAMPAGFAGQSYPLVSLGSQFETRLPAA